MGQKPQAWKFRVGPMVTSVSEFLSRKTICVDYGVEGLRGGQNKEAIEEILRTAYLDSTQKRISAHVGQLHTILNDISEGDIIVVPIRKSSEYCIGIVESEQPNVNGSTICFSVKWKRTEIPLTAFQQDLRHSFKAIMKVCEIKRNNAVDRLQNMANGGTDL